jgi:hypothetical protein
MSMMKRLDRIGELNLLQDGTMQRIRYYELLTRGKWIYYECIKKDRTRTLLRFDYENYQVLKEPLTQPVNLNMLHRYKYVEALDMFYHLEVREY